MEVGEEVSKEISVALMKFITSRTIDGVTSIGTSAISSANKALINEAFKLGILSDKKSLDKMLESGTPLGTLEMKKDVFKEVQKQANKLNMPISNVKLDKDTNRLVYRKFDEQEIVKILEKTISKKLDKGQSKDETLNDKKDGVYERMDRAKEKVNNANENKTQVKTHDKGTRWWKRILYLCFYLACLFL